MKKIKKKKISISYVKIGPNFILPVIDLGRKTDAAKEISRSRGNY